MSWARLDDGDVSGRAANGWSTALDRDARIQEDATNGYRDFDTKSSEQPTAHPQHNKLKPPMNAD